MIYSKKTLLGVGAVAVSVAALWAGGFFTVKKSAPEPETAVFNSRYGFSLSYPKEWLVDDSQTKGRSEFISAPDGNAFVAAQILEEPRLKQPSKRAQVKKDVETSFKTDSQSEVESLSWQAGQGSAYSESYESAGLYTDKDGKKWRYKEIGILHGDGTIVVLRSMATKEQAAKYSKTLDDIIYSFAPAGITGDGAVEKVKNRPEVTKYISDLVKAGKQATIEAEDGGEEWNVHVFEIVKQDDGSSHTATFGWYSVNKKTGKITIDE